MMNIKKNLGYQTIYQILSTALPLITSPYLSRVLGAEQLGIFSYTQSIVSYFTLFAMLGLANYGTRAIAQVSTDRNQRSKEFCSIFVVQFTTSLISVVAYVAYLLLVCKENMLIASIQILAIISCFLDINWLFFGLEQFEITVKRNIIVRILTVVAILVLVKSRQDLWIYALIMVISTLISQAILWFYVPKVVDIVRVKRENVVKHIKPNLVLFLPLAAMSVYHVMDKTMLGMFSTFEESGYYYNADKIINIPAGIISGISTVLMPRITALIGKNEHQEMESIFKKSLEGTFFVASALAFGIAAISKEFVPVFFGNGYEPCIYLTILLSPILIIKGLSFTFRYQYLIPYKMDKKYIQSILAGMAINLIANLLLIPKLGASGAVIGTLIAEFSACLLQAIYVSRRIQLKKSGIKCVASMLLGLIMFVTVRLVVDFIHVHIYFEIAIGILTGVVAYLGGSVVLLLLTRRIVRKH